MKRLAILNRKSQIPNLRFQISNSIAVALLFAAAVASAAERETVADYQFIRVIDQQNVADNSGHGNDALLFLDDARAFVETPDGWALRFTEDADRVEMPWKAFPGGKGSARARVWLDSIKGNQVIWRVYSSGDGLIWGQRDGRPYLSYYNRSKAKWYRLRLDQTLRDRKWYDLRISWDTSKEIMFVVDGVIAGREAVSEEAAFPAEGGALNIGNTRVSDSALRGMIQSFSVGAEPLSVDGDDIRKNVARGFPDDEVVTVANDKLALSFDRETLAPVGGRRLDGVASVLNDKYFPADLCLWRLTFRNDGGRGEMRIAESLDEAKRSIEVGKTPDGGARAILTWKELSMPDAPGQCEVVATVDLPKGSDLSYWKLSIRRPAGDWLLWQVDYPLVTLAPLEQDLADHDFIFPYRWGNRQIDPFGVTKAGDEPPRDRSRVFQYFSGGMQMQFFAVYGRQAGTYFATYDGAGYIKKLKVNFSATRRRIDLAHEYMPSLDEGGADRYETPYAFVLGGFDGDWFDACQIYRQWALKQPWCAKGPLVTRADSPKWLRENHVIQRASRSAPQDMAGMRGLLREFGPPVLNVWYNWSDGEKYEKTTAVPNKNSGCLIGYGRIVEPYEDIPEKLRELRKEGVRTSCYIQSKIYDQGLEPYDADAKKMRAAMMLDANGDVITYNKSTLPCWIGNQANKLWQDRLIEVSKYCQNELGFTGIYLDSFGRGGTQGFDPTTGRPIGRGTECLVGAHTLGERVRDAIRADDPEAFIMSEASIEYFLDVVDTRLCHFNAIPDPCPLYFAVYHDYQYIFGRTLGGGPPAEFFQQLGNLFCMGAMAGRFFGDTPFREGEEGRLEYLRKIVALRKQCVDFLHLGTMARPVRLEPKPALLHVAVENRRPYDIDEVLTSSWTSADGRAAVTLLNMTETPRDVTMSFDATEYGFKPGAKLEVVRRTPDGGTPAGTVKAGPVSRKETLAPYDAIVLELKPAGRP